MKNAERRIAGPTQNYGWGLFRTGLKRRSKEVRRMRLLICLAVFFLALTLLLQDNLGDLQMAQNCRKYGSWFGYAESDFFEKESYLDKTGDCLVGSNIYLLHSGYRNDDGTVYNDLAYEEKENANGEIEKVKPPIYDENGELLPPGEHITVENFGGSRNTYKVIGAYTEGFAERNDISLYEGHMPEKDNEIVMEREALHALGLGYELGQEIVFYVAENEPVLKETPTIINGEPQIEEEDMYLPLDLVRFTLVGTVRVYTMLWNGGSDLPSAIVTESAFKKLPCYSSDYKFYDLVETFDRDRVWEVSSMLFERYQNKMIEDYEPDNAEEAREKVFWNKNAYADPLWGSGRVYNYISIALVIMSTSILAYLIAAYLASRRQFFMQAREMGATSSDVWWMAVYECVASSLPYAAGGLAAAYLAAYIALRIIASANKLEFEFMFHARTLITIVGVTLAVLAASMLAAYAIFSGRGIAQKRKALSNGVSRSIRRRAEARRKSGVRYLGLKESLPRVRRSHALKTCLIRLACILIGAVILFSFMQAFEGVYGFFDLKTRYNDLQGGRTEYNSMRGCEATADTELHWSKGGTRKVTTEPFALAAGYSFFSYRTVLDQRFMDELRSLPGIKDVTFETFDYEHRLSWPGKWEDTFLGYCIQRCMETCSAQRGYKIVYDGPHAEEMRRAMDASFYSLLCYDDTADIWKKAKPYLGPDADYAAFVRGEQVIVFVDQNAYAPEFGIYKGYDAEVTRAEYAETAENLWEKTPSFRAGDTVYIDDQDRSVYAAKIGKFDENDFGEGRTPVTVAAVLPMTEFDINTGFDFSARDYFLPIYLTVGSLELSRRVAAEDGVEFGANLFQANFTSVEEAENAMKFISGLCSEYKADYLDNVEWLSLNKNNAIDKLLTYGFFSVVTTILYVFVIGSIARQEDISLQPKYAVLHRAGSPWKKLRRDKCLDALKQSLWQLLSLPLYLLINFIRNYMDYLALDVPEEARATFWQMIKSNLNYYLTRDMGLPAAVICCLAALMLILWLANKRFTRPAGE